MKKCMRLILVLALIVTLGMGTCSFASTVSGAEKAKIEKTLIPFAQTTMIGNFKNGNISEQKILQFSMWHAIYSGDMKLVDGNKLVLSSKKIAEYSTQYFGKTLKNLKNPSFGYEKKYDGYTRVAGDGGPHGETMKVSSVKETSKNMFTVTGWNFSTEGIDFGAEDLSKMDMASFVKSRSEYTEDISLVEVAQVKAVLKKVGNRYIVVSYEVGKSDSVDLNQDWEKYN